MCSIKHDLSIIVLLNKVMDQNYCSLLYDAMLTLRELVGEIS